MWARKNGYIPGPAEGMKIWGKGIIKGQLISKWFLGVVDFLQKTNEQIQLYYYDTSGWLVFVRLLEEIDNPKKPFWN